MSMQIKLVRVDSRLLHSTISLHWNRFVGANHVLTVEPYRVIDPFIEKVMRLSLPKTTQLHMLTPGELTPWIENELSKNDRVIVVFKDIFSLALSVEDGFFYSEIQIPYPTRPLVFKHASDYFDEHTLEIIRQLQSKGMSFYFQTSPIDSKIYLDSK